MTNKNLNDFESAIDYINYQREQKQMQTQTKTQAQLADNQIKYKIIESAGDWFDQMRGNFGISRDDYLVAFDGDIKFDFSIRGGKNGMADWDGTVYFNLDTAKSNLEKFLNSTVPHEMAHLVDFVLYKTGKILRQNWSAHGRSWKRIMLSVGLEPSRCNGYAGAKRAKTVKRFVYKAECGCEFNVTSNLHNKIQAGSNRICGQHKKRLVWTGKQVTLNAGDTFR